MRIQFNHMLKEKPIEVYWTPIERCNLIETPPSLLQSAGGIFQAKNLEAYATSIFELISCAPFGLFYLLRDTRRREYLGVYCVNGEASRPVLIKEDIVERAMERLEEHCRVGNWRVELI
ncbi:hypothetical protein QO002_005759 [Pararhizobium capsulatum DSM 1112]|uniref:Uncharacterized protein n=1 Tax=Pararhizobium capsulatum DSM 1112 TaxID=1121113 RepID=A0ABU0BZ70_9HYPH|nr:hypothetical protein [Pararhizobium capsulatum]MDQ0323553.1 hypothetical protein [Pararhizobium capsulatum DSM 1112]